MSYLQRFRSSRANLWWQRFLRVLQFLSSIISLGLFSTRIAKILRLTHRATASNGAVEGILAAGALYTLAVMLLSCCLSHGGPKPLRWLLVLMDILFIGAFTAVAVLTRPHGGSSGPCDLGGRVASRFGAQNCRLPWGTFILAIISTVLHLLTALFHEVRDHHRESRKRSADSYATHG